MPLVLQALGRDEALDLGGLGVRLLALVLGFDFPANDVLANLLKSATLHATHTSPTDIVLLLQAEEAADLGRALRSQALRMDRVGQARDLPVAELDDAEREDGEVRADDAAADALPLALAGAPRAVARVAGGEQQAHARRVHDALLHREALLVVAARDAQHVALELVAEAVRGDLLAHPPVHEDAQLAVLVHVEHLLRAVRRVRDVELHRAGGGVWIEKGGVEKGALGEIEECRRVLRERGGQWHLLPGRLSG